jgi:hypothetical protein
LRPQPPKNPVRATRTHTHTHPSFPSRSLLHQSPPPNLVRSATSSGAAPQQLCRPKKSPPPTPPHHQPPHLPHPTMPGRDAIRIFLRVRPSTRVRAPRSLRGGAAGAGRGAGAEGVRRRVRWGVCAGEGRRGRAGRRANALRGCCAAVGLLPPLPRARNRRVRGARGGPQGPARTRARGAQLPLRRPHRRPRRPGTLFRATRRVGGVEGGVGVCGCVCVGGRTGGFSHQKLTPPNLPPSQPSHPSQRRRRCG